MRVNAMRGMLAFLVVAWLAPPAAAGGGDADPRWTHTRCLTSAARSVLDDATSRSPLVRSLATALEKTNVIVYVATAMSGFNTDFHAQMTFMAAGGPYRYLLVKIDAWATPDDRLILLGHELQHALEVAAAPQVRSRGDYARLYVGIGRRSRAGGFETDAAQAVGLTVSREIRAFRRRAAAGGKP